METKTKIDTTLTKCSICNDYINNQDLKKHINECNYYDIFILKKRSEKYHRINTFQKMIQKHALGKCNCKKKGKECNYEYNEEYQILFNVKQKYLSSKEEGDNYVVKNISFFETLYNSSQSITQSLKTCAGKDWETSFQETLEEAGFKKKVHFETQVNIDNDGFFIKTRQKGTNTGHKLDFV